MTTISETLRTERDWKRPIVDRNQNEERHEHYQTAFSQVYRCKKNETSVCLKQREDLLNHVGSIHATAIYGLAEAASGDYIITHLMPLFPDALALARQGSIKYKRPAESESMAEVKVSDESLASCIETLKKRNRATLTVPVHIYCDDKTVATAEFDWWFSLK